MEQPRGVWWVYLGRLPFGGEKGWGIRLSRLSWLEKEEGGCAVARGGVGRTKPMTGAKSGGGCFREPLAYGTFTWYCVGCQRTTDDLAVENRVHFEK